MDPRIKAIVDAWKDSDHENIRNIGVICEYMANRRPGWTFEEFSDTMVRLLRECESKTPRILN